MRIAHLDPFTLRSTVSPEARSPHPSVFSVVPDKLRPGGVTPGLCQPQLEWPAGRPLAEAEWRGCKQPERPMRNRPSSLLRFPPRRPARPCSLPRPRRNEGGKRPCMWKRLTDGSPHPKPLPRTLLLRKRRGQPWEGVTRGACFRHKNPAARNRQTDRQTLRACRGCCGNVRS